MGKMEEKKEIMVKNYLKSSTSICRICLQSSELKVNKKTKGMLVDTRHQLNENLLFQVHSQ